jgi:hypothetical protein
MDRWHNGVPKAYSLAFGVVYAAICFGLGVADSGYHRRPAHMMRAHWSLRTSSARPFPANYYGAWRWRTVRDRFHRLQLGH